MLKLIGSSVVEIVKRGLVENVDIDAFPFAGFGVMRIIYMLDGDAGSPRSVDTEERFLTLSIKYSLPSECGFLMLFGFFRPRTITIIIQSIIHQHLTTYTASPMTHLDVKPIMEAWRRLWIRHSHTFEDHEVPVRESCGRRQPLMRRAYHRHPKKMRATLGKFPSTIGFGPEVGSEFFMDQ
jgi:hypothetical protein